MASSVPLPPPGFEDLSIEERIDYLQSLWDRISAKPDAVSVPDWHREVISDRLATYKRSHAGPTWEEVRDDILHKLRSRSG